MFIRIYNTLISILYPLVIKRYIKKRQERGKEDVKRFNERVGRPLLKRPEGRFIWFHGASVGESLSMLPLINKLLEAYPDMHIMVTTGTTTSSATGTQIWFCGLNRNSGPPCFPPLNAETSP